MEQLPSDSVSIIKNLLLSLSDQLGESNQRITSLESLTSGLLPEGQELPENEGDREPVYDEALQLILSLEEQRNTLVMDLQKQDYVTTKLRDIIDRNLEVLQSINGYLVNNGSMLKQDLCASEAKLTQHHQQEVAMVQAKLEDNVAGLQTKMADIDFAMQVPLPLLKEGESNRTQQALNATISAINQSLDTEFGAMSIDKD